jgi:hypothetical protein
MNYAVVACQSSMQRSRRFTDGFWRMSGHPAVQQALRNHSFDSLGLPDSVSLPKLNPVEPPRYGPVSPWCGRGGTARCPPIPIKISSATLTECPNYAARRLCDCRQPQLLDDQVVWVRGLRNCLESRF